MARHFVTTKKRTPLRRRTKCNYGKTKDGVCKRKPGPKKKN